MVSGIKYVVIADIESVVDKETGDRYKGVSNGKQLALNVELVGVQTAQLGQAQGVNLSYSVEIPRIQYNNEKYCYFDNQLYEVSSITKAKLPTNMLLNVAKLDDVDIENAIREWLNK